MRKDRSPAIDNRTEREDVSKICQRCDKFKDGSHYRTSKRGAAGLGDICKECTTKKRSRKPTKAKILKKAMIEADKALSEYARERDRGIYGGACAICLDGPVQCCFHIVRRKRKILRWDERNVVGACHRCNYLEYRNPDPSRARFIRIFGVELYLKLCDESATNWTPTLEDLHGITEKFKQKLGALQ